MRNRWSATYVCFYLGAWHSPSGHRSRQASFLQLMAFGSVSHALTLRMRRRFCQGLQPCAHAVSAS
jgi:hypothetical protein